MDWSVFAPIATAIGVPTGGYLVKKVIDLDKQIAEHVAADAEIFRAMNITLRDLKGGQDSQTLKLDRLIDHMLDE